MKLSRKGVEHGRGINKCRRGVISRAESWAGLTRGNDRVKTDQAHQRARSRKDKQNEDNRIDCR